MKYFMYEFMLPFFIISVMIVGVIALSLLTYLLIKEIFE
jgi:hypothetical protein